MLSTNAPGIPFTSARTCARKRQRQRRQQPLQQAFRLTWMLFRVGEQEVQHAFRIGAGATDFQHRVAGRGPVIRGRRRDRRDLPFAAAARKRNHVVARLGISMPFAAGEQVDQVHLLPDDGAMPFVGRPEDVFHDDIGIRLARRCRSLWRRRWPVRSGVADVRRRESWYAVPGRTEAEPAKEQIRR